MKRFLGTAIAACVAVFAAGAQAQEAPDSIYLGGPILTMEDGAPRVEAVAVKDGRILAAGTEKDIRALAGEETKQVDLGGHAMLPGFVDAHGHVGMVGILSVYANLLSPPDGEVRDIASLQQKLRDWADKHDGKAPLIIGFGYDDAQLSEQRHPTRDDLDAVSKEVPVAVIHQSSHLGAFNSAALELVGITAETPNPEGGVIRRVGDTQEPNGVLEENAFIAAISKLTGKPKPEQAMAMLRAGTELVASYGYTTAQDGRTMPGQLVMLKAAAEKGLLKIDVVSYPDVLMMKETIGKEVSRDYKNRFRIGGAKLSIDGSPQGFTAWRDRPYYNPPESYPRDWRGYPAATEEQVIGAVDWAFENNIQILTHANGEAASDLLIKAVEQAEEKYGPGDRRPVLIHGQFLREDQVDAYKRVGVFPSLFPMHTFYWGDWHRERTVGPELVKNISPTGWVRKRGMMFSTHHDAPVAMPNSMRVLSATVTRVSRTGHLIGPDQRVDVETALKAMTIWPAWQHFEEETKGSIKKGKLADFVILSEDPTAVAPEALDEIKVLETVKEGETIYKAE
ncbi:amidohydrolase [Tepidicaulis sp. LMO-SS28]|uniref:amidohydrolase n=1 Tax=Tepidicaulis sp. LMO-SS28 TaxID=3447455 RepID=UPI003EDF9B5C